MKKFLLLLIVVLATGLGLCAQDTIVKVNGDRVVAKVTEVGQYTIRYKRYNAPDGPVYDVKKTDVRMIVYSDGTIEHYSAADNGYSNPSSENNIRRRWLIGLNSFDMLFGVLTASVQYNIVGDELALRVPLSAGVSHLAGNSPTSSPGISYYYYSRDKIFSSGLDLLYYPAKQHRVASYYTGVSLEYGEIYTYDRYYYVYPYTPHYSTYWFSGTGIINGFLFQPSDRVNISLDATIGMAISNGETNYYSSSNIGPLIRMGMTLGYRFGNNILADKTK
ncbi:MAG TPA: hypothetical protein VFU15_08580 [Bacteroidia bacterium]|nr:hypothetical protein [Bacteroidia bacterium]